MRGVSQDARKAVLENMRAIGKEAGLKSFEQVRVLNDSDFRYTRAFTHVSPPPPLPLGQVKDLHLHPEMFSIANGLLTPTLKSRRADIRRVFQEQIANMYGKSAV